jgi:hypothetical protein
MREETNVETTQDQGTEWLPIESAPKEDVKFLVRYRGKTTIGWFHGGDLYLEGSCVGIQKVATGSPITPRLTRRREETMSEAGQE